MSKLKDLFAILIIMLVVGIVFSPYLLGYVGITPNVGTNDNVDLQSPFRQVLQQSIKDRRLPLWEPRISTGFPLFAEGQIAALYPPNLIFAALPIVPYYSVTLSILFSVIVAGTTTYFFLKEFLNSREEESEYKTRIYAIIGAIFWIEAGIHFNHTAHVNVLNVFSWLPFQLLIIERRLNNKDSYLKSVALLALPVMLQILAGHPQFASYSLLFISLYWFINQLMLKAKSKANAILYNGLAIGCGIILGLILGAVQLLPTLEFTVNSTRQTGLDEESVNFLSFRVQDLQTLIMPFQNFTYEPRTPAQLNQVSWPFDERYSYIGLIPLALAFISLAFVYKKRQGIVMLILGLFFFLLALGNQTPFGFLLLLPPLNLFRIPTKFTTFAQFAFVILATIGLKGILDNTLYKTKQAETKSNIGVIAVIIIIVLTSLDTGTKLYTLYPIQKGEWWFEKPATVKLYEEDLKKDHGTANKYTESRIMGQDYNIQMHKQYLEQDPKLWDTMQMQVFKNNRAILPAFDMLTYDVPLIDNAVNSAGLKVKWYSDIEKMLFFAQPQVANDNTIDYPDQYWKSLQLTGAKYIFHNDNLQTEKADIIGKTNYTTGQDQIAVYKIKTSLPFIQTPPNITTTDAQKTYAAINQDQFNPATDLVLPNDNQLKISNNTNTQPAQIAYIFQNPQHLTIQITNSTPAIVFIRQTYFPGWTALIDKKPSVVIRANHAFQAVQISEPGTHTLELQYQPKSFTFGVYLTVAGLVTYIIILIADVFTNHRKSESTES